MVSDGHIVDPDLGDKIDSIELEPDGFPFPEGVLSVSTGSFFDTVVLSSNVSDFAIDNVTTSEVPEPATSATLLLGLAIVAAAARRRLRS